MKIALRYFMVLISALMLIFYFALPVTQTIIEKEESRVEHITTNYAFEQKTRLTLKIETRSYYIPEKITKIFTSYVGSESKGDILDLYVRRQFYG